MVGEALVIVASSKMILLKSTIVETCTRYVVSPATAPQLKVGLVEIPVAASEGDDNTGAACEKTIAGTIKAIIIIAPKNCDHRPKIFVVQVFIKPSIISENE